MVNDTIQVDWFMNSHNIRGKAASSSVKTKIARLFEEGGAVHQALPSRFDTAKLASFNLCSLILQCPGACSGVVYFEDARAKMIGLWSK